jgi:hypothetical protein
MALGTAQLIAMKYHHNLAFSDSWITDSEAQQLMRIKPGARNRNGFGYSLVTKDPAGDEFIQTALDMLKHHSIPRRMIANSTSYGYYISRFYEPDDLENAELLLVTYQNEIQTLTEPLRDQQGRLLLKASSAKASLKVGCIFQNWIIVSDAVRHSLEAGNFIGLKFGEVAIKGKSIHAAAEPFWELLSFITLPKMPHPERFVHRGLTEAQPFQGDYSRVVLISDPPFAKAEVHYRRSDLEALGPFQIAQTFENYMEPHPALVISQRFYQHCLKNKIPLAVEPVRIDPE